MEYRSNSPEETFALGKRRQKRVRFTVWMEILEWARQFLPRVLQPGLVLRNR